MEQKTKRFNPDLNIGLTDEQVNKRIEENLVNYDSSVPTKSIKQIISGNFLTLFNFLNLILGIAIFCVGSYKNMLFLGIMIINTAISTFQEIHSKRIVDKLSIMAASKIKVKRNGTEQQIAINDLVLDDIAIFNTGNQIPTDCIILDGDVLVNESFITGEPDSISKVKGDMLLSGSYIVGGKCIAQVEHIADENYTAQISSGAKYVKKINSEIMNSLNKIIKWLTFAIIPIGILLFLNQLNVENSNIKDAIVQTVAAIIGMIPEGLVLLTSTVLAVSVIRLSRAKVLVQELYCIETLARVDTLCLDKTGTLTEGRMEVKDFIPISINKNEMQNILANIANFSEDENPTIQAIKSEFLNKIDKKFTVKNKIAFSSKSKWSGINFENEGSYILGAPEFILKDNFNQYENDIKKYSEDYRVLLLAHSKNDFNDKDLPNEIVALGFVLISDVIRKEASETLEYFKKQGVDIKIISEATGLSVEEIKQKNDLSSNTISKGDILIIPFKQRWTPKMIRTIMTDETQIGTLVQGKTERRSFKDSTPVPKPKSEWIRVPHCHEANLDLETFEIVSKMFNKESKRRPQKNGEVSIFIKKVYCGCCGKAFVRNTSNVKSGKKEYLMCKSKVGVCDNRESID